MTNDLREKAIAQMARILRSDLPQSSWNTDEEIGAALDAALALIEKERAPVSVQEAE